MTDPRQEKLLSDIVRQLARDVEGIKEDHRTAAMEHDDFTDETNAAFTSFQEALQMLAARIEDLERSHAALTMRVDRLQGLG